MPRDLGGHRIEQRQLHDAGPQMAFGDGARAARRCRPWRNGRPRPPRASARSALSVISSGSPGPTPTPIEPRRAHTPLLASALTAAAVIALPPRRPFTHEIGHAVPALREGFLRFRRADEADGNAEDRRRPRRAGVEHLEQTKQRRRRIADGDDGAGELIAPRSSAAAERVVPRRSASAGTRGIAQRADHRVARRQPRARDAVRDHLGIAQDRRAGCAARPRAAATRPWPNAM